MCFQVLSEYWQRWGRCNVTRETVPELWPSRGNWTVSDSDETRQRKHIIQCMYVAHTDIHYIYKILLKNNGQTTNAGCDLDTVTFFYTLTLMCSAVTDFVTKLFQIHDFISCCDDERHHKIVYLASKDHTRQLLLLPMIMPSHSSALNYGAPSVLEFAKYRKIFIG